MSHLEDILREYFTIDFISAVISGQRKKGEFLKVKIRPVMKKETLYFQCEEFKGKQAFHSNEDAEGIIPKVEEYLKLFKQMQVETTNFSATVLVNKKGGISVKKKARKESVKQVDFSHNRKKHYILEEGVYVPFLEDLGVMTKEGKIIRTRYDKFRQINRFLEFIEDVLPKLPKEREITILDFGCGKSYLTFAMYYYLHDLRGMDIRIIGLDLKSDVIRNCQSLAEKYGYEKLKFLEGDIADYEKSGQVDMVVTLHACDTATDYALAKAVGWNAKVILSVPFCQHELNGQMKNEILAPIMKYGLLKERLAALLTDGLRAEYLEREGYDVQILEFIDMEHTPKNILIRAVKQEKRKEWRDTITACEEFFHVSPAIGKLLDK